VLILVLVVVGLALAAAVSLRALRQKRRGANAQTAANDSLQPASAGQPAAFDRARTNIALTEDAGDDAAVASNAPENTPLPDPPAFPSSPAEAAPAVEPAGATVAPPGKAAAQSLRIFSPVEIFAKLNELALGTARPASMISAGHNEVIAATAMALRDRETEQRYTPRRPNMLPRVLNASNDDDFSRRELAALISRDSSLVGNLLKIANSPYYRVTPEPVESVDRAVVLLGTEGIRSVVTAALMQPIFRIGGADFPRFPEIAWEHTFRSATAAVSHNFLLEKSDPFAAELLCHVMGLAGIVVFRVVMDQYAARPRLRADAGVVGALLDTHSAAVARRIGASWDLSEQTLTGLDGQTSGTTTYPTALGRSLYFGRVVGALAALRSKRVLDAETAKASIPATTMPEAQLDRMWARVAPKQRKD